MLLWNRIDILQHRNFYMLAHRSLTNLALLIIKNVIKLSSRYADVRMHKKMMMYAWLIITVCGRVYALDEKTDSRVYNLSPTGGIPKWEEFQNVKRTEFQNGK